MRRLLEGTRAIGRNVGVRAAIMEERLCISGRLGCLTKSVAGSLSNRELQLSQDLRLADLLENAIRGQVGSPRLLPSPGYERRQSHGHLAECSRHGQVFGDLLSLDCSNRVLEAARIASCRGGNLGEVSRPTRRVPMTPSIP